MFNWQTEEEAEELWAVKEQKPGKRPARRRWFLYLTLLALLGSGGFLAWRAMNNRLAATQERLEGDVVSSYTLARRAVSDGDREVLDTILSGASRRWVNANYDLLEAGLALDRAALPFGFTPTGEAPRILEVNLDPELRAAEVVAEQLYEVPGGARPVALQQTVVYRRGGNRWLMAPPEASFWGSWEEVYTPFLMLTYPERDEEIARRLAADLDRLIQEMCLTFYGDCSSDLRVRVFLNRELATVLKRPDQELEWHGDWMVELPAPSLVGLPADEESYQALLRGYARPIVASAIRQEASYNRCCQRALFYEALMEWALHRLDLGGAPLAPEQYRALDDSLQVGADVELLWEEDVRNVSSEQRQLAYALVELLLQGEQGEADFPGLLHSLQSAPGPEEWVVHSSHFHSLTEVLEAWPGFLAGAAAR